MILTVDVGNTNIKVGAWDNNELAFVTRLQTNPLATSDEYAVTLLNLFRIVDFNRTQFDGAIISSVVPQLTSQLSQAIKQIIQVPDVLLVSPGLKTGLNIKIDDPATLGSDLVCAGVAVASKYPLPAIIIGLGTATTMFVINEKSEYLGGTLAPGINISLNALSSETAQLPHISLGEPTKIIGTNTVESMLSGVVYGNASMLDGMIRRINKELGVEKSTVIAGGGLAQFILPHCEEKIILDDNLVLEGLRIIFNKNS